MEIFSIIAAFGLGLLIGFYESKMYAKIGLLIEEKREAKEAKSVGVVKISGIPTTRNQPIDLSSQTGGVRKPTPAEVEELRQIERAAILRENHK